MVCIPFGCPPKGLLWCHLSLLGVRACDFYRNSRAAVLWSFGFNRSFGLYRRVTERTITFPRLPRLFNRSEKIKPNDHIMKRLRQPPAVYGRRGRSPPSSDGAAVSDRSWEVNVQTKRSAERTITLLPKTKAYAKRSAKRSADRTIKPNDHFISAYEMKTG
jgi:hypothetical protein